MRHVKFEVIDPNHVIVDGALTLNTVPDLVEAGKRLIERSNAKVPLYFQLGKVGPVDSAGVALLLAWYRVALKKQVPVFFTEVPKSLKELCSLSGLHLVLPLSNGA